MCREGFLEELAPRLMLEGSVCVYWVRRWGWALQTEQLQRGGDGTAVSMMCRGVGKQEKAWRRRTPLEHRHHPEEFVLLLIGDKDPWKGFKQGVEVGPALGF